MWKIKHGWREDAGSIDFVQIIVGLIVVGAACIGTFQALEFGNNQLNTQMRYRKAISIARSEVEYWQGRVHTDYPSEAEMLGTLGQGVGQARNSKLLDDRDPLTETDDIYCDVRYGAITAVPNVELGVDKRGNPLTSHFVIRVYVTWVEPGSLNDKYQPQSEVIFQGSMVPASF